MTLLLLASVAGLAFTFAGYPLAIWLRARVAPKPVAAADWQPRVDIVVVGYNDVAALQTKLANLRALDYPHEQMHVHLASDGSEDLTPEFLREIADEDERVSTYVFPRRRGKSACLGDIVRRLDGEIVVFTDARQRLEADAVRALLRPLADPAVGAVSGELMFEPVAGAGSAGGIDAYWRYEKFIRRSEAASGSVVGVSGALYAARRGLLPEIPEGLILDDLWIPLEIARRGARVVFAADARAWDRASTDLASEARRKRRTLAGNFQLIARTPSLLLPWTHPFGWRLWGHKWLRLLAPWLMIAAFVSNVAVVGGRSTWKLLLLAQCLFYAAALAGLLVPRLTRVLPIRIIATFVRMNGFAIGGAYDFFSGRAGHLWSVTRHTPPVSP